MKIALYVCPQTVCSSLSMAMDAFVLANRLAGQQLFELQRVSLDGKAVDLGFAQIQVDGDLSLAEEADLILLAASGSAIDTTLSDNAALLPWLAPVAFVFYITRFQVRPEERVLAERFGPAYTDYTRRVRRWL